MRFFLLVFLLPVFALVQTAPSYSSLASSALSDIPSVKTILLGIGAIIIALCLVLFVFYQIMALLADSWMEYKGYSYQKPEKRREVNFMGRHYKLVDNVVREKGRGVYYPSWIHRLYGDARESK
jgi:hypothetical protein